jgi:hypothetical protein
MKSLGLILGAGWSYCAGLPLARELFDLPIGGYTEASLYRLAAVLASFGQWQRSHPDAHAEEFVADAYRRRVTLVAEALSEGRAQLELEGPASLPWPWVVEYIQTRLAVPLPGETRQAPARYAPQLHMPTRSRAQQKFWSSVQREGEIRAVVTTNYDLLAEPSTTRDKALNHEP